MIEITIEDFKLIKSFYPEFARSKGIRSNRFIIDWNGLMPVVEKIEKTYRHTNIDYDRNNEERPIQHSCTIHGMGYYDRSYDKSKLNAVYKAVVLFIKWYNENGKEKT